MIDKYLPQKIIKSLVFFFLLFFTYVFFTSGGIAVNANGNLKGVINELRALIQGKYFWKNQLREINAEIEQQRLSMQDEIKLNQQYKTMSREVEKQVNKNLTEFYKEVPSSRPSAADIRSEKLRSVADEIERQEHIRLRKKKISIKIDDLHKIKIIINNKIQKFSKTTSETSLKLFDSLTLEELEPVTKNNFNSDEKWINPYANDDKWINPYAPEEFYPLAPSLTMPEPNTQAQSNN